MIGNSVVFKFKVFRNDYILHLHFAASSVIILALLSFHNFVHNVLLDARKNDISHVASS